MESTEGKRKGAYDKSGGIIHDTAAFAFHTKDILKIRSRPRLEPGSDYHYLVRKKGLEPSRLSTQEPKSCTSANSVISANGFSIILIFKEVVNTKISFFTGMVTAITVWSALRLRIALLRQINISFESVSTSPWYTSLSEKMP